MKRPTVLILTTHAGGGHMNLAQALKDAIGTHYDISIVDPQPALFEHYYTSLSRHFLKFWDWQFKATDNELASLWLHKLLLLINHKRLSSTIERIQPQLIIITHEFLAYSVARVNEQNRKHVPLVFQLTDLGRLHMTWFIEKHADAYLVPTREIYSQMLEWSFDKTRLHLTGRPLRSQFLEESSDRRSEILAALNFDPAVFTIFLQGGAKGSAGVDRTIESILSSDVAMQIILAVGNNKGMATRYAGIERVRVLPFTELIAPYMAAADVIVGKAGASFICEAYMLEKPFLVTAFIPGQEAPNLQFIERHNLGWVCLETVAQKELLSRIASNRELIAEKLDSIRAYKAWNMQANQHIYPVIDRLLSMTRTQEAV